MMNLFRFDVPLNLERVIVFYEVGHWVIWMPLDSGDLRSMVLSICGIVRGELKVG
jgi:hypothetical protein